MTGAAEPAAASLAGCRRDRLRLARRARRSRLEERQLRPIATRGDIRDRLGRFPYLLAAAYAMRRRTAFGCELGYAGTTEKVTLTQLSVTNAPVFGGPLQLSVPDSNPDDRLLDMLAIRPITPGRMLRAFG